MGWVPLPGEVAPSLGGGICDWIESHCIIPDGDRQEQPYLLTPEMERWVLRFYSFDPVTLRFAYRRGILVRPQKWGKGPFSAAIVCAEAYGPVLFSHWDDDGRPVGKPWPTPHIQITAVSEDQTDNVWRALQPMIELGDLAADIPDTGLTRINLPGGGLIEPVTSSARSRLGQRITFAVQDETHSWLKSNGGWALADNQRRNLAGMGGRSMETTNAWDPAEQSVAQRTWEADSPDILKDISEGPANLSIRNKRERRKLFVDVYRDSAKAPHGWVDLDRIDAEVAELVQRDAAQAERFFGNRIVAAEDAFMDPDEWDARLADFGQPADGEDVTLGFDGSISEDSTGLVGCHVPTGHEFLVAVWEKPDGPEGEDWEVPVPEVNAMVAGCFDRWNVRFLFGDPAHWRDEMAAWYGIWGDRVREWWWNRPKYAGDCLDRFHTAVVKDNLTQDGSEALRRHVLNARKWKDRGHTAVRKKFPQSPDKIDLCVCAALAYEARAEAILEPEEPPKQPGQLIVF